MPRQNYPFLIQHLWVMEFKYKVMIMKVTIFHITSLNLKPKIKNVISILFWDVTILYLGCRNIVIPPNKGWTWANPFAEFLHLCKTGLGYNHIGQFNGLHAGFTKCNSQLHCVAQKLLSYESRVKAMQTDFHNHQKRWKWYINIYLCSPITKFSCLNLINITTS